MNQEYSFQNMQLSGEIQDALKVLGYKEPTKIQEKVIPLILDAKDILAGSKTGSGKTAAFAIPICEKIEWDYNEPQALIIEPTRELTVQVKEEIYQIGRKKRLKVADVFGGFPIDKQLQTLRQKTHIVVGTPGRLLDHIRRGSLKLDRISYVVIDEADLMFDMGFSQDVEVILGNLQNYHSTSLFSATLTDEVCALADKYLADPIKVRLKEEPDEPEGTQPDETSQITQKLYTVEPEDKYDVFLNILMEENPDCAMIFCGTKEMVNVLCRRLRKDGVKCSMIHGDIDQQDRIRTINDFREGKTRYLIATDIVARGIDFYHLSHVLNYDFPTGRETYIHRIGRTGRKNDCGTAVSLMTPQEEKMRVQIEEFAGYKIPECIYCPATAEEKKFFCKRQNEKPKLRAKKGAGFASEIMRISIGGGRKSKIRATDIVGAICNIEGVTGEDIGVIDVRESLTYVEILNKKGNLVIEALQTKPVKGKLRKVRQQRL